MSGAPYLSDNIMEMAGKSSAGSEGSVVSRDIDEEA